MFWKKFSTYQK